MSHRNTWVLQSPWSPEPNCDSDSRSENTRFAISHKQWPPAFQELSVLGLKIHITFNSIVSIIGIYSIGIDVRCVRSQWLGEAGQGSYL